MTPTARPWVAITNYPTWPSPYFGELRHSAVELGMQFAPHLRCLRNWPGGPGTVNLHRLKRLYQDGDGRRTAAAARSMLADLTTLRAQGWKLVWTVHNLLPIDGPAPCRADRMAAAGVLEMADAVVAHTHADGRHLRTATTAPVTVAGWGGLTPRVGSNAVSAHIAQLARRMRTAPVAILLLGNLTDYKGLPAIIRAFVTATERAELFIIGPPRSAGIADEVASHSAGGRVHLLPQRIEPHDVCALYEAADAALCPYRTDGPWQFFRQVLHPSSVGTAVGFGVPVIAPDLPAIREMTHGRHRWLYPPQLGPGPALAAAEGHLPTARAATADEGEARWIAIGAAYTRLAVALWENS